MTTELDRGTLSPPTRLECPLTSSNLYITLRLALRDMRDACGRDAVTGAGDGNASWIGLTMGMIVLDTLTGSSGKTADRWKHLLTSNGVSKGDAKIIYMMRCSLLHGYGPPKSSDVGGRRMFLTPDPTAFALDTSSDGLALLSVPVFCGYLVERLVTEAKDDWDKSLIDTNFRL